MDKEKLIEILSRYFQIGDSYAYNLTRDKQAFSVGTMHLDDFEEFDENTVADIADHLIANGVIVPPCKVGDTVYYFSHRPFNMSLQANTIYEADVVRIVTSRFGTSLIIQIHDKYGVTETPEISSFGKTVFLTREEAEKSKK